MNKQQLADQLKTSMGQKKAELVLKNAKIVNVFTHEIEEGNIAIENGMIAGIGDYEGTEKKIFRARSSVPALSTGTSISKAQCLRLTNSNAQCFLTVRQP